MKKTSETTSDQPISHADMPYHRESRAINNNTNKPNDTGPVLAREYEHGG
jgi:hypothetical protein